MNLDVDSSLPKNVGQNRLSSIVILLLFGLVGSLFVAFGAFFILLAEVWLAIACLFFGAAFLSIVAFHLFRLRKYRIDMHKTHLDINSFSGRHQIEYSAIARVHRSAGDIFLDLKNGKSIRLTPVEFHDGGSEFLFILADRIGRLKHADEN